jgi:Tfp pilus assembly protein PilN
MRPVNLIPPEERRGEAEPLRAGAASYVIVGVLAAALLAVVAVVLTGNSINEKKSELESLQARQAQAQNVAAKFAPYATFASTSEARQTAVQSLADSRFDWDRVLHELALVIPDDIWLQSLSGSVVPGASAGEAGGTSDPSITGPSLQLTGCGRSQDAVAGFLAAVKDIDGVTRVGFQGSELGDVAASEAAASGGDPAASGSSSDDCQTRPSVAKFDVTVAFDAVPLSAYSAASTGAAVIPAATTETTPGSTTSTTPTTGTATTSTTPTTTTPAAGAGG